MPLDIGSYLDGWTWGAHDTNAGWSAYFSLRKARAYVEEDQDRGVFNPDWSRGYADAILASIGEAL